MSDNPEPAGLDFGALLQQAQAMQEQMAAAQEQQAATIVTGTAGGNKVSVEMTGGGQFVSVSIAPDVVDPTDVELLEELVLAALHNATTQVAELQESAMGQIDMGGLDLGGLLGGE